MTMLAYKARSAKGRTVSGRIDAPSAQEAVRRLRRDGVHVVSINQAKGVRAAVQKQFRFHRNRVKLRDLLATLSQLELMIGAGTGLDDALKVTAETARNERMKTVLTDVRERVKGGESFSTALAAHEDVFDMVTVRMIAAGEASGTLPTMLRTLHDMMVRQSDIRRTVKMALAYPAVLLSVAMAALCVLFIWVLPKFAEVFAQVGAELPQVTVVVMSVSQFITSHKLLLGVGGLSLAALIKVLLGVSEVRMGILRVMMKMPIIGHLIRASNTARAMHVMGTLWRSGLPIMEVTRLTGATLRNPLYSQFFEQLRQQMIDGKRIVTGFNATDLFPSTVAPLIRTGEETGHTPAVLEALAAYHEKETASLIKTMITLMEPAIIVVMAGGVGLIAISVVVPLFRLSSAVH